ncbi:MAG: hypothetical protein CML68_23380 [Rhodobacteraceae bacterium]|nr:hypothetical protein [Paracoccaceae bacterium]
MMTQAEEIAGQAARTEWSDTLSRFAPLVIIAFFVLQVVSRVTSPGGVGLDEAEQMVATQTLELGYGAQPPLYTWLQLAVFQLTGPGKLGLALLKHVFLAATYLGIWVLARQLGANRMTAAVAMFATLLLPSLSWESQRALTHTVLATALTVWTMNAAVYAARTGQMRDYVLTGVIAGLGFISKWNFGFIIAGLLVACLVRPELRNRKALVALGAALLVSAVPVIWAVGNWHLTTATAYKFDIDTESSFVATSASALASLVKGIASIAALAIVVLLLVFRTSRTPGADGGARQPEAGIVELAMLGAIGFVVVAMLATGATTVEERWLLPILVCLPMALTLRLMPWLTAARVRWFFGVAGVVLVAIAIAYPMNMRRGKSNPSYQSAPFEASARALGIETGLAVVSGTYLAGNLRLIRPELKVLTPGMPKLQLGGGAPDMVLWWSRDKTGAAPLADLQRYLGTFDAAPDVGTPAEVTVPYPAPHADRMFSLYRVEWSQ